MMKKKVVVVLALALVCLLAVGGTLSYFTDTASEVNVMTVGKVEIVQHEQYRYENVLAEWDALSQYGVVYGLYPYAGECDATGKPVFSDGILIDSVYCPVLPVEKNAVDKIVTVENTGTEAAYIRTVFAFEMEKSVTKDAIGNESISWVNPVGDYVGVVSCEEIQFSEVVIYLDSNGKFSVVAEGAEAAYVIGSYTYPAALAAPQVAEDGTVVTSVSTPSLLQVYLGREVGNEFYEAVGGEYEVLILSQGTQTQGFEESSVGAGDVAQVALDTAFGKIEPSNGAAVANWFNNLDSEGMGVNET